MKYFEKDLFASISEEISSRWLSTGFSGGSKGIPATKEEK